MYGAWFLSDTLACSSLYTFILEHDSSSPAQLFPPMLIEFLSRHFAFYNNNGLYWVVEEELC